MDLLCFCDLYGGKLPKPLAQDIVLQVVKAAPSRCNSGVLRNDVKPENILINIETLQVKLIDFGYLEVWMFWRPHPTGIVQASTEMMREGMKENAVENRFNDQGCFSFLHIQDTTLLNGT